MSTLGTDEILARSVSVGHEVTRKISIKFNHKLPICILNEIQHQVELSYMQAVKDVFVRLSAFKSMADPVLEN
jgi:hypothetical protein